MKKAVENGKIQNYLYEANFKRTHDKSEINEWCTNNGFVRLSVKEGQIDRFGKLMNGIVSVRFATYSDYAYLMEQEQRNQHSRDEARSKNRGNDVIAAFAAVIGIGAILVGGYIINKEIGSRNGNYNNSNSIKNDDPDLYGCFKIIEETSTYKCEIKLLASVIKCNQNNKKYKLAYFPDDKGSCFFKTPKGWYYLDGFNWMGFNDNILTFDEAAIHLCDCGK
ncbi:MAG: hypothetical protein IPH98_16835 [Saprospiraceae bacterium]|nr:hypothetical protein [Candidatus Defluviibacterium haderslevense]